MDVVMTPEAGQSEAHQTDNASGFLTTIDGRWFVVTAGHVLQEWRNYVRSGWVRSLYLCDAWSDANGRGRPLPLPIEVNKWHVLGDADTLDLGAIEVGPLLAASLAAGRIETVPQAALETPPPLTEFDFFALLGTPREFIKPFGSDAAPPASYDLARGVIEVEKVDRCEGFSSTPHDRFYGRLVSQADGTKSVKELGGVSGGPILGCKRAGGLLLVTPIAVQSGWVKEKKTVVADYLIDLVPRLRTSLAVVPGGRRS
jgi:hypothetical protein